MGDLRLAVGGAKDAEALRAAAEQRLALAWSRFKAHGGILLVLAAATAVYVVFGGLALWMAALTLAVAVVVAVARGTADDRLLGSAGAVPVAGSSGEASWRPLLDAVPDPMVALDRNGIVLHLNPAARVAYPEARVGGTVGLISRDHELLQAIDSSTGAAKGREFALHERVPVERRTRVILSDLPELSKLPGAPASVLLLRDLTEQDRLSRMRADFVANASHELRTPLASLSGFIETLQGRAAGDAEARVRFLGIMSEQAERMRRLVDDLLSLSRVEMHEHVAPMDAIELAPAVEAAVRTLAPLAAKAGVRLSLDDAAAGARVRADRDQIVQVTQNLVQNAIKYGRPNGDVRIRISREGEGSRPRIAVEVADDGPGIAPEHLPRLTERFYRVSAETSREKGGTGLGLAIVKHIVNRHRGELRIRSRLGEGSSFTFVVPEA